MRKASMIPVGHRCLSSMKSDMGRRRYPSLRRIIILSVVLVALACNSARNVTPEPSPTPVTTPASGEEVVYRFLLAGWAFPEGEEAGPFAETLRAFVVTTEEELRDIMDRVNLVRIRGNLESLFGADLGRVVVLATYHLWRPLKGDPLSITGVALKGSEVEVSLELLEDPLGRESPYLVAPLYIASIDREDLPRGVPLSFVFLLNGEFATARTVTLE